MSPVGRQQEKGSTFRAMHAGEPFVMPNPWDGGSARILEALGFTALATTSSGFAFTLGLVDGSGHARPGGAARRGHRHSDGAPRFRRSRERLWAGSRGRGGSDPAGREGRGGRRFDRGLRPGEPSALRDRPRQGADPRRSRGCSWHGLPVHAHRPCGEPHPRQPRPCRHDPAAPIVRGGRRRRPLCAGAGNHRGDPRFVRFGLEARQRSRRTRVVCRRDRGRRSATDQRGREPHLGRRQGVRRRGRRDPSTTGMSPPSPRGFRWTSGSAIDQCSRIPSGDLRRHARSRRPAAHFETRKRPRRRGVWSARRGGDHSQSTA